MTSSLPHAPVRTEPTLPSLRELVAFVIAAAADRALVDRLRLDPVERTWIRLDGPGGSEAWLIGWPPGTGTGWHDHGGSAGAFAVARGYLDEFTPPRAASAGGDVVFAPGAEVRVRMSAHSARGLPEHHLHDVCNTSAEHAISVHVYAPALSRMTRYVHENGVLAPHSVEYPEEW
ncbi:cysteine dioxygenase [Yinghuangia sp. ASG 101]|uniref:cysteine dioxygenase n=1 Tax=Yinghuangia sp. ASG 101 TaxID=2896848 RepID=UPI001E4EBB71|nr:cysteine dioxygenase [Yinghuangia sp. ASG 101]UGQ13159.1 cysteine dioxygenase [Yinghuangia sp. ASG 101]